MSVSDLNSEAYLRGIELFNRAEFFEAHEVLEDVWRAAPPSKRKFLQGLIQVAVALHHYGKQNRVGARSLLERAARNLAGYPSPFEGIAVEPLRQSLAIWQEALDNSKQAPPLPRILMST
jgi:predicted metal-dependent hydrolase